MSEIFSAEAYFATQPPPPTLDHDVELVKVFIKRQMSQGRRVAFVTSGGTTVPLEHNVVRFLDNFSAGTRGSTSAEYFLSQGYAVIFMHRQYSLQPFSRHYSHSTNPFLDFLDLPSSSSSSTTCCDQITVQASVQTSLLPVLQAYKRVQAQGTLHTLTFVTVNEYLFLLRAISKELSILGPNAIYYLAAAVSDFFLPTQKMSEHKIQSGKGSLLIEMDQVPKIIKSLVDEWTPKGFIVSFKLETDHSILIPKARTSLERYGHQLVIGNTLHERKHQVVLVTRLPALDSASASATNGIATRTASNGNLTTTRSESPSESSERSYSSTSSSASFHENWIHLRTEDGETEIEKDIIEELVKYHDLWVDLVERKG